VTISLRLELFTTTTFSEFPWQIEIKDWTGRNYSVGQGKSHWYPKPLQIIIHTQRAAKDLLALNALGFIERYLEQEVDIEGNFYLLTSIKHFAKIKLNVMQLIHARLSHYFFQTKSRSKINVKSHYDIPQQLLEFYLDKTYMAYSCAMFESSDLNIEHLPQYLKAGLGQTDKFDSLEKAQWRKFKDAVDFLEPKSGQTMLDVGCGYGGQLQVALENYPNSKIVGWTHSSNQVSEGRKWLNNFDRQMWELNEGDYREDNRIYDHICSTGMISHVGPRGLLPYVRNIRKRIKSGGRYVHHSLMAHYSSTPLDAQVGIAFNKKYVWPGFHWFTLAEHIKALEENGFIVLKVLNLKQQYSKTLTCWHQRLLQNETQMKEKMGEATFRAWKLYLGGGAGLGSGDVNRIYCRAN